MDDGEQDEKIAAILMQSAREWVAKAEAAQDRRSRLVAITEAINASGAAVAAIETWRLSLFEERQKLTGEPVFEIEPVLPPPKTHH